MVRQCQLMNVTITELDLLRSILTRVIHRLFTTITASYFY